MIALDEAKIELLFVTLDELFHWQTQNNAGPDTPLV
jgi:hypothetical protein